MPGPEIETRAATTEELPRAIATLVAAFIADPITRFACPDAHAYLEAMPLLFRVFGGASFEHGSAQVSADLRGVSLWLPPGVHPDEERMEGLLRERTPAAHLDDMLATLEAMGESHPEEPHWYLPLIGVDPSAQGSGLGGALMRDAAARFDAEGALAYLESSNPRNISLYERHGFEAIGRIQIGAAPLVTPMVRRPRSNG